MKQTSQTDGQNIAQTCTTTRLRDPNIVKSHDTTNVDNYFIVREEIVAAIRSMKNGKAAGADNILAELSMVEQQW